MAATPTTVPTSAGPARPAILIRQRLRGGDEAAYIITFIGRRRKYGDHGAAGL